jgi:hypothetical protein
MAAASKGASVNIKRHGAKTSWQAVMAAKSHQARGVARMPRTLMLRALRGMAAASKWHHRRAYLKIKPGGVIRRRGRNRRKSWRRKRSLA